MSSSSSSIALLSITILTLTSLFLPTITATGAFTVDLIRRDTTLSPYDRLHAAIQLSLERLNRFRPSKKQAENPITSTLTSNLNEFLMRVLIGTPPVEILAVADTGSDLIWTNCKPCNECYTQIAPLFDPSSSETYRNLSCSSGSCSYLGVRSCGARQECSDVGTNIVRNDQNTLLYVCNLIHGDDVLVICPDVDSRHTRFNYGYGDGSYSAGVLSSETLTFSSNSGRPVSIPKITFGCAHQSGGLFDSHESGLVGLGGGPLSLVSQLGPSIDHKFSYCLVPFADVNSSSTFTFGPTSNFIGSDKVSTPLSFDQLQPTFYQIRVDSIQVGTNSVVTLINLIVDSGTTLTFLPSDVLTGLITAVSESVNSTPMDDPDNTFGLCYGSSGEIKLPDVKIVFRNNAALTLPPSNTFLQVSDTVVCLAILAGDTPILGNIAQQNFVVEFDVGNSMMSFVPRDCTK